MLKIFIDGASRGNPGPASVGIIFLKDDKEIKRIGRYIGKNTNNVAEYTALIFALLEAIKSQEKEIEVFSDSALLVNQIKGTFKIKNPGLKGLHAICKYMLDSFSAFTINSIPREENKLADSIANDVLDNF